MRATATTAGSSQVKEEARRLLSRCRPGTELAPELARHDASAHDQPQHHDGGTRGERTPHNTPQRRRRAEAAVVAAPAHTTHRPAAGGGEEEVVVSL